VSLPRNCDKQDSLSARAASNESLLSLASKKKLYQYRPDRKPVVLDTFRTRKRNRLERADPASLERGVRELLATKVSGDMMGLWLLVPEHLRLGTWDMLCGWTQQATAQVEPRLALQLVHEAALCVTGVRQERSLSQKGFELLNGLPFVASDLAVHQLLEARTVADATSLQVQLGLVRRARGHFQGRLLAIDPHRVRSYSKRQMCRYGNDQVGKPYKVAPTFFCLDADTHQPVCFTTASSAFSVSQATAPLLKLAAAILNPVPGQVLVLADSEHLTAEIVDHCMADSRFDLLVPMDNTQSLQKRLQALPENGFTPRWAGFATTKISHTMKRSLTGSHQLYVQRSGERADEWQFKAFLSTRDGAEVDDLTLSYPRRWHVEEFFNAHQALGWNRAGTRNLNVRYGQMTMALMAQAAIHQFRQRFGPPWSETEASHLARSVFQGMDGDIRVSDDTILVTFYNAPDADRLREHYEGLPKKLAAEHVDPRVPWLYGYRLDFRFK
jgi:hypothetical protein